jgi:hypothetical protein
MAGIASVSFIYISLYNPSDTVILSFNFNVILIEHVPNDSSEPMLVANIDCTFDKYGDPNASDEAIPLG